MSNLYRFIVLFILLIATFIGNSSAQDLKNKVSPKSERLGYIASTYPEELIADAFLYNKDQGGTFAIRFCSANSITTAYGIPSVMIKRFEQYLSIRAKIPKENIFYSYGGNCVYDEEFPYLPELWWIPKGENLLKSEVPFLPCQMKISGFGADSDKEYIAALKELAAKLRSNNINFDERPQPTGFVTAVYYNYYPRNLQERIKTAKKILAQEIKDHLVVIEAKQSQVPFISEEEHRKIKEQKFPRIFYVEFQEDGCVELKK